MPKPDYVSTTNACKLCTPMGAALAFRGIEQSVPYLHGSQGCATYMRRYIISHFREPMDIASSSLNEKNAVFGGGPNLKQGLLNARRKYGAQLVGVATTCLTETIGDDVPGIIHEFKKEFAQENLPELVTVSTPSYNGTHMDGWHAAVRSIVEQLTDGQLTKDRSRGNALNLLPGFVSPADIRHLKEITDSFGLATTVLPDYSETLDGPALEDYELIPSGGTPIKAIKGMGEAKATIEFGSTLSNIKTAGDTLFDKHGVPLYRLRMPIGLRGSDDLFLTLSRLSGKETPKEMAMDRGRLVDAYVDGHKYLFGRKALVYGEEDLVTGLVAFLAEIGVKPVIAASGGKSGLLKKAIREVCPGLIPDMPEVMDDVDFYQIRELAAARKTDLIIGNSKGAAIARELNVPLVRVGFPVHDRFGAQRILHLGYRGTQNLLDTIVNTIIAEKQANNYVGYGYM
jgi:nitrogenase molybdenum-iron protein NifN